MAIPVKIFDPEDLPEVGQRGVSLLCGSHLVVGRIERGSLKARGRLESLTDPVASEARGHSCNPVEQYPSAETPLEQQGRGHHPGCRKRHSDSNS